MKKNFENTIFVLSTNFAQSAIAVFRISGSECKNIAKSLCGIKKLRDRLELTQLAIQTGAPLTTAEVSFLMGAKPGKKNVERGGLVATKISRNIWKIAKNTEEKNYWRN